MNIDEAHFKRLIDRYLAGKASPAEKKLLDEFFDTYPGQGGDGEDAIKASLWNKLVESRFRSDQRKEAASRTILSITPWYSVAAVFALFITVFYFLIYKRQPDEARPEVMAVREQHAATGRGQKLKVELVDGSEVILNANSKLTFPEQFSGNTREVFLDGEAYFRVAHNAAHPFIVHTRAASTTVLGTSFNIKSAEGDHTEITLVEGKVDVLAKGDSTHQGRHQLLLPNQQALIAEGSEKIELRTVDVSAYTDWKDNVLRFDHVTMAEAARQLENWYNVDIEFENPALAKCIVSATYKKETLKNILSSFEFMLKIRHLQEGNRIVLKGKGC